MKVLGGKIKIIKQNYQTKIGVEYARKKRSC